MTLFDVYTDYLIVSDGQTSATGLSRASDETISHDSITRMLSSMESSSYDLWKRSKPFVRRIESEHGVMIIDDSLAEKPHTDENEVICWHYDHCKERSIKGINFQTLLYNSQGVSLPICVQVIAKTQAYVDAATGRVKRRSPVSKNDYAQQMLLFAQKLKVPYGWVLGDIWYSSAENMKFIHQRLHKRFIFALKSNRMVAVSLKDKQRGQFTTISALALQPEETLTVYLKEISFALTLLKHVFTNEDGSSDILYLVSNDLRITGSEMVDVYKRRWAVEPYHKSLKQNASLTASPTRTPITQKNHLFAAVCAYIKLESLKFSTSMNHFALKNNLYMAALITAFDELRRLKLRNPIIPDFA